MPPRYSYWTIIIDDKPTAFRAAMLDDLLPTFNRLKQKHPTAVLMWFQRGRLWPSRQDAQAALAAERRQTPRAARFNPSADRPPRDDRRRPPFRDDWGKPPPRDDRGRPPFRDKRARPPGAAAPRPWTRGKPGGPGGGTRGSGSPPRDRKWRPGGDHRDPRQKYKDAKKARWTRFKQRIRQRFERRPGKKKDDDES
jgi:hypothetical protein